MEMLKSFGFSLRGVKRWSLIILLCFSVSAGGSPLAPEHPGSPGKIGSLSVNQTFRWFSEGPPPGSPGHQLHGGYPDSGQKVFCFLLNLQSFKE